MKYLIKNKIVSWFNLSYMFLPSLVKDIYVQCGWCDVICSHLYIIKPRGKSLLCSGTVCLVQMASPIPNNRNPQEQWSWLLRKIPVKTIGLLTRMSWQGLSLAVGCTTSQWEYRTAISYILIWILIILRKHLNNPGPKNGNNRGSYEVTQF